MPPPARHTLPDGQQVIDARVHARRRAGPETWDYDIGVAMWMARPDGTGVQPGEYRVWVPDRYVALLEGIDYDAVPTAAPVRPAPPPRARAVRDVEDNTFHVEIPRRTRAPDRQGRPVRLHRPACRTFAYSWDAETLDREGALAELRERRAVGCSACGTDYLLTGRSSATPQHPAPPPRSPSRRRPRPG